MIEYKSNVFKNRKTVAKNISKKEHDDLVIYFACFNFIIYGGGSVGSYMHPLDDEDYETLKMLAE